MKTCRRPVEDAAAHIRKCLGRDHEIALITGTGLDLCAEALTDKRMCAYGTIPHFSPATTVAHAGRIVSGRLAGKTVLAFQGRFHLYEGYSARQVVFPVHVIRHLGIRLLILTNAAGGLNLDFQPGDLMIVRDHINLTGENPLTGPNENERGPRFPAMHDAYHRPFADRMHAIGRRMGLRASPGVYVGLKGPSLETTAEIRFLRMIGADAVGMSTVLEVIAAVHAGIRTAAISVIGNINNPDRPEPATVEGVVAAARQAAPRLTEMIAGFLEEDHDRAEG